MSSANLNRYIKEYLKRQPKTLSMSQIEELVEYDAWLDEHGGLTPRAVDGLRLGRRGVFGWSYCWISSGALLNRRR